GLASKHLQRFFRPPPVARRVPLPDAWPGGYRTMRRIEVRARANGWVVRVEEEDGGAFHYTCASERQARDFPPADRPPRPRRKLERKLNPQVSSPAPRGREQPPGRAGGYVPA